MVRTSLLAAVVVALWAGASAWTWVTQPATPMRVPTREPSAAAAGAAPDAGGARPAEQAPSPVPRDSGAESARRDATPARSEPARGPVPPAPDDGAGGDAATGGEASAAGAVVRPDAALRLRPRGERVGDRLEYVTRLDLELDAEIDMGIFSPSVTYELRENETLRVTVLPPVDGRAAHDLEYVVSRATRTLPVVGSKQKEHKVHGKTYRVVEGLAGAAPRIVKPNGKDAPEKEATLVQHSLVAVAGDPPLASALDGDDVPLDVGEELRLDSWAAKRLLGLPLDELEVDDVRLVLRAASADRGTFDVTARLRGQAALGDGSVGLKGKLSGTCVVLADGARLLSLDLAGRISVEQDAESGGLIATSGSGPLSIKRSVTALDG